MEWFVQTPEHSFKTTLGHSTLLVVFSLEALPHRVYSFSSGVVRLRRLTFLKGVLPKLLCLRPVLQL